MANNVKKFLEPLLTEGLNFLGVKPPAENCAKLLDYVLLLNKWSGTYNLTAITEPKQILIQHIFDSLTIAPYIVGANILDVGSGAGLPGIPLALAFPEYQFTLLDSNGKKTTFLNHVILDLKIINVKVVQQRVEQFQPQLNFNTIVTRATAALSDLVKDTQHLRDMNSQLLVMKGKYPVDELDALPHGAAIIHKLHVPKLDAERHAVIIMNCE